MKSITILLITLFTTSAFAYEQKLPSCEELSKLWTTSYYNKLNPNWGFKPLPCNKEESRLSNLEKASIVLARAAYVLDKTVFNYRLPTQPIVAYGRIQAPPKSMLNWVAKRISGISYNAYASSAHAGLWTKRIHLTPADFNVKGSMEMGIGLAGQIIHEARHAGIPVYRHVTCTVGDQPGTNCDPTISEEFDLGGSHAVAALWLAYVARNSYWPQAEKDKAADVVKWVLNNRINDSYEVRNAFAQRYLWESL